MVEGIFSLSIHVPGQVVGMASTSSRSFTSSQNLKEEAGRKAVGVKACAKPLHRDTRIFPASVKDGCRDMKWF